MQITQGDAITLRVCIREGAGGPPQDLTGATFTSYFPAEGGGVLEIPNSQHTPEDQEDEEHQGWVGIAFSAEDSAKLKLGKFLSFTVKVTQGEAVKHYHSQKGLSVLSPSPVEQKRPQSNILIGGAL